MPDPIISTHYLPCTVEISLPSAVTGSEGVNTSPLWLVVVIIASLMLTYHLGYKVGQSHPSPTTCKVERLK